jgi:hypothetical protein
MPTTTYYRPGETVPTSGIYAEVKSDGSRTGRKVTCVKGEPFPPTQSPGVAYVLHQRTNP